MLSSYCPAFGAPGEVAGEVAPTLQQKVMTCTGSSPAADGVAAEQWLPALGTAAASLPAADAPDRWFKCRRINGAGAFQNRHDASTPADQMNSTFSPLCGRSSSRTVTRQRGRSSRASHRSAPAAAAAGTPTPSRTCASPKNLHCYAATDLPLW